MSNTQSMMTNSDKTQQFREIVQVLTGELRRYDRAWRKATNDSNLRWRTEQRDRYLEGIVPENFGARLAKKYDMLPDGKVGQYIDALALPNHYRHKVACDGMIMIILLAGILYGEYEFLKDLKKREDFSKADKYALRMMAEDVDWVRENVVTALDILSNKPSKKNRILVSKAIEKRFGEYHKPCNGYLADVSVLEKWCENVKKHKKDIYTRKYHMIEKIEQKLSICERPLYLLYQFLQESLIGPGCVYNINGIGNFCVFERVSFVKNAIGGKYLIARSTNLWTNEVVKLYDSAIDKYNARLAKAKENVDVEESGIAKLYDMLNLNEEFMKKIKNKTK